ncbi:hypothetical protein [Campylobacter sp. CCS1377]|uniref:Uncharacterized protein n=1 Tax=Campylobacter sp. CCS1377 TaxID=3158229 RepID=A0AAU7E4W6_9BACT|nr:hypothetical protein [Campylobacter jejuni]
MASILLQLRVDSELKKQADELFNDLGLDIQQSLECFQGALI